MGNELTLADSFRLLIIDKLIDMASSYLNPSELEDLRKASPQIQTILSAAEQGHFNEHNLEREAWEWLQKLKNIVDEMEYILDEMEYRRLEKQGMGEAGNKVSGSASASRFKKMFIKAFFKRTPEFEKNPILERLRGEVSKLYPVAPPSIFVLYHLQLTIRLTSEQQNELDKLVTVNADPYNIFFSPMLRQVAIKMLMGSSDGNTNASVVSIVGTQGVWKTILAQFLYKLPRIKERFAAMMWICVSSTFDGALLLREVIARISDANAGATPPPPSDGAPLEALQEYVKQELATKNFLLVLDDIWLDEDISEWEKFAAPLINNDSGSKILLTTRMDATAHLIGEVIDLDEYSSLDCYYNVMPPEYDELLVSRYQHLPGKLQKCLRFYPVFRRDHVFHKEELIYIWMVLGFLQKSKYKEGNLVDVGGEYFDILLKNSFFGRAPHSQDAEGKYIIKSLMYDLAIFISEDECGTFLNVDNARRIRETIRHLTFIVGPFFDARFNVFRLHKLSLHTFFLQFEPTNNDSKYGVPSKSEHQHILQYLLTHLERIRVLIISGYKGRELPDEIGSLLHLRLLRLEETDILFWPTSMGKLHHLKVICKDRRRQ